jgi:hypothetical protein
VLVTHDYRCGVFKEVGGLTMMERKKLKAEAKKKKTDDEEWGQ